MLETCTRIWSHHPEQHIDIPVQGRLKVLGYASPIGNRCYRQTDDAFIQIKKTHAITVQEGTYQDNWLVITTRTDNSAGVLLNGNFLTAPRTLSISVGGDQANGIVTAGAEIYSIGLQRRLLETDPRCQLLKLALPDANGTFEVSQKLRQNLLRRINMLMVAEMNHGEFHMELIDLMTTLLSSTSLKNEYEATTNRTRIVQRATTAIASEDPKRLNPSLIASLSFTSIRTLEYSFREILSMTPKQYIDFYRINLLREKIIETPHIQIMHLGYEVGLSHLGNLSKNYKALYGETPSATKRRLAGFVST